MPLSEKLTFWITNVVLLALLAGCSSKEQPKNTALTPYPVASQVASPSEAGSVSAVFTPKELPDLGTVNQALDDTAIVLQLVVNGKTSDGITEIPKTSMAGVTPNPIAVKEGYPPEGTDVCSLPYSALIRQMYEQCFKEGESFNQVSNIIGWQGEEVARAGSSATYRWGSGDSGSMVLIFDNDRLVSKSQSGLEPQE